METESPTTCDCIEQMDADLQAHNTKIDTVLVFGSGHIETRIALTTRQIEKGRGKQKAVQVIATYCPICGKKYPEVAR